MPGGIIALLLSLVTGLAALFLAGLLALIARFYERTSGEATGVLWFALPGFLLLASSGWELIVGELDTEVLPTTLRFVGGTLLIILCSRLFRQMTACQKQ